MSRMFISRFCRACAAEIYEACEIENNPAKPELPLLLRRYIPEFDIKVESACLCFDCVSLLYTFHNFKRKCLRTEEDLRLHIRKHPEVKAVNLNDIFAPKEQTNNTTLDTSGITEETISDPELSLVPKESPQTVATSSTPAEIIQCEICSLWFPCVTILQTHIERCHERKRYQCDKCSRIFGSKKLYDMHVVYHKEPAADRFVCKECNFVYQSSCALNKHNIVKHMSDDKKPFKCELCAKRFVQKSTLTEHTRTHTIREKLYKCPVCNKYSTTVNELDRHINAMHKAKMKVICTRCRHIFPSETSLQVHQQNFHRSKCERYQCDQCSRDFVIKNAYHEHLEYHKRPDADRFMCKICNFVYPSNRNLQRHNVCEHPSNVQKSFQCEVCAKRFVEKSVLVVHMRMHTGEKPYKCSMCSYACRETGRLNKHFLAKHNIDAKRKFNRRNKADLIENQ